MEELINDIKQQIIDALNLEEMTPDQIDNDAPLFGEGLGLDSIDALELGVALKKRFGVKFNAESAETREHFASVNALAEFISSERAKNA